MGRNYTPPQQAEIQKRLTELVWGKGHMTLSQLEKLTGVSAGTVRRYLEMAVICGDLYHASNKGVFPSEQAFLAWSKSQDDYSGGSFLNTSLVAGTPYDRNCNVVCAECRNSPPMQRILAFYRNDYREVLCQEGVIFEGVTE